MVCGWCAGPYEVITPETFNQRVCEQHERPKINERKWPPPLCTLLPRCWAHDFNARPEFAEVVDILMTIVAEDAPNVHKRPSVDQPTNSPLMRATPAPTPPPAAAASSTFVTL